MVPTTRRRVLAVSAALTAGLAGCSGGQSDDDGDSSTTTADEQTETIVDDTLTIAGGEYESWEFSGPGAVEYDFSVTDGPAVDVYVLSAHNFDFYRDGESIQPEAESEDSSGDQGSTVLGSGDFVVLVDNTDAVGASPPEDDATADVEVEATVTR